MKTSTVGFFQSEQYTRLQEGLPGFKPFVFKHSIQNGDSSNLLTGIRKFSIKATKRVFSRRVVIIGEPPLLASCVSALPKCNDWQFRSLSGGSSIYTELRFLEPPKDSDSASVLPYSFKQDYLNILVDTTVSSALLFTHLSDSKKRQVKASLKAGAAVRPACNEEEVMAFYQIASKLYSDKIKKPMLPLQVFLRLYKDKTNGVILLVIFQDKVVGGMLCPFHEKEEMYEWYIAGLDEEMKKHKVYPSVLVTWEAISYASDHGYRQFNFMGAGIAGQPYGTRDFKMQFGGKLVDAPRYIFVHKPILYKLGKWAIKLGLGS